MGKTTIIGGRLQIPLSVRPQHDSSPTITASIVSKHAGTALFGYFRAEYMLPGGDQLLMFANHNKGNVQLLLLTHDPEKLRALPGARPASIVANAISQLNRYCIRCENYSQPLTEDQEAKKQFVQKAINSLTELLNPERELAIEDWEGQEDLREKVITILNECSDENLLLANQNPVVSTGELGNILYDACEATQDYQFNRAYQVSAADQLDFRGVAGTKAEKPPCFIWDSESHIGNDEAALLDSLRVICKLYQLDPGEKLTNIPANRLKRLGSFLYKLWVNSRDFINYLATPIKPTQPSKTVALFGGLFITETEPYYSLEGIQQKGYSEDDASKLQEKGVKYFQDQSLYYPLPNGDDLFTISQLSTQHLYVHERLNLQLKAFFSRLPTLFIYLYRSTAHYITHDLYYDVKEHIHADHEQPQVKNTETTVKESDNYLSQKTQLDTYFGSLQEILTNKGLLANGQTLEEFIATQLSKSNYVLAHEQHPPSPVTYDNPLHRFFGVFRHLGSFFVHVTEKNPIVGTLAVAAYFYGAGAIIAPEKLTALLTKLHANGLISGIEPTQEFSHLLSHGTISEAITASVSYWQGIMVAGKFDAFFIQAVELLKDEPAEVAIVTALALSLGYGISKAIPALEQELGPFPYPNYAFLGIKGGIAINDTVMHPGEDWLLGTIKWLLKGGLILVKLLIGPVIEGYHYGAEGFFSGISKSVGLVIRTCKQTIAAFADLGLAILTMPFREFPAMLLHVPFRGLTNLLSKTLAALGNWRALGTALLDLAPSTFTRNYLQGFYPSPLFGFYNPCGQYAKNGFINILLNGLMLAVSPPLQLIKNLVILPVIDILSLTVRILLTILHPPTKIVLFTLGTILTTSGILWDNSIGLGFQLAAKAVTLCANRIDNIAGQIKQLILGQIQILRLSIYNWAYSKKEDLALHAIHEDKKYMLAQPELIEKLPHKPDDSTSCLLHALVANRLKILTEGEGLHTDHTHHGPLFQSPSSSQVTPHVIPSVARDLQQTTCI